MAIDLTPPQIRLAKLLAWGLLAIIVVAAAMYIRKRMQDADTAEATIDQQVATGEAATGIGQDLSEATTAQQAVEVRITADTRQLARDLEELRRENPKLDHWLRADIPRELRQLACKRRLARDRSGAAPDGRGATDPGAPAAGDGNPGGGCDQRPGVVRADDRPRGHELATE